MTDLPTSPSSPGSEDSTLLSKPSGLPASDRSNGTSPAPLFSIGTGPTSRDGETLLPTPNAGATNYDEDPVKWRARQAKVYAETGKGNGPGNTGTLGIAISELTSSVEGSPANPLARQEDARPKTTHGGSGLSSPVSFASLDPDGSWLRTSPDSSVQASLLGPLLQRFFGIWPKSGSLRDGTVYAHPMSEPLTDESGYSWLRTPMANPANPGAGGELRAQIMLGPDRRNGSGVDSMGRPNSGRPAALLPTPEAWLGRREANATADPLREKSRRHEGKRGQRSTTLPEALAPLLPTPTGGSESKASRRKRGNPHGMDLEASLGDLTNPPSEDGQP